MPMIKNKNIEKKLCYSKIKEATYSLVDVISKVRNRSEPKKKIILIIVLKNSLLIKIE
jgi:uncharacterized protein YktA (UPF0223 family)